MRKINKVILGVAAGSLTIISQSHGYSGKVFADTSANYQDNAVIIAQNVVQVSSKPTPTYASKPTPTYASKPTPTYGAKPTPTYAAKPTVTYAAKPSPKVSAKATPTPQAKSSPKVTPTPQPKPGPKATANIISNFFSNLGKFFSGLFGR